MSARFARACACACATLLAAGSGCYYGHLALGQTRLLLARQSVQTLLEDPQIPDELRVRLELSEAVRAYAALLGLDVGAQYTSYVAWPGDRIVTTVVATRPGEIDAMGFSFPIVGRLPYKGFFARDRAEREAEALRAEGLDVCVVPVTAYSTLGWLADPLTEPMLASSPLGLAETLVHEFVHATVFIAGEADFNEGVASFIGEEAAVDFARRYGLPSDPRSPAELARDQRTRINEDRRVAEQFLALRHQIEELYQRELATAERERSRLALEIDARASLAALPLLQRDAATLAERAQLGDACLALRGTYAADTSAHARILGALDGDLRAFVERLRAAGESDDPRARFFSD